jgi:hypothetical protein
LQGSTTLEEAIKQQSGDSERWGRTQPYILRFGTSFFIVADSNPIVVKPSSLSVALDTLLKLFYVVNVEFPCQTRVMHNLMAQVILQVKCNLSAKAMKIFAEIADDC